MAANLFSFFFVAATDKRVAAVVQNVKASVIYGTNGIGKLTVRKVITPSNRPFCLSQKLWSCEKNKNKRDTMIDFNN
jgi:hypothetical protein